jgi:hypothetical protein
MVAHQEKSLAGGTREDAFRVLGLENGGVSKYSAKGLVKKFESRYRHHNV